MEYELPQDHKGLLQAILRELIKAHDPDATFVEAPPPAEAPPKEWQAGDLT